MRAAPIIDRARFERHGQPADVDSALIELTRLQAVGFVQHAGGDSSC